MFVFFYKLGQTLGSLTSVKPNMQSLLLLLASCLAESLNTPHGESSVTKFWGRRENLPRPWFEQWEVTIIAFGTGLRMTLGRGLFFVTSGSPYPANPTSAPRVVHLNTPQFLSPPQNRLLHGTATFVLLPFTSAHSSTATHLPHRRPRMPHWSRSTVVAVHGASSLASSSTVSDLLPGIRRQAQKYHRRGQWTDSRCRPWLTEAAATIVLLLDW